MNLLMLSASRVLALVVLVVGLLTAALSASGFSEQSVQRTQQRFAAQVDSQARAVADGLRRYEDVLVAERAWLTVSERITRRQFAVYAQTTAFDRRHRGMQGLGFQAYVRDRDRDAFLARARSDGPAGFSIVPPGRRSAYYVVFYNEPASKFARTWGFDARSNPTVRPFLDRARDTGLTTLSGRAVLGVDLKLPKARQPVAFGLFVPVYRRGARTATVVQRRAAFLGWASSPFRARDFLRAVDDHRTGVTLALYDEHDRPQDLIAGSPRRSGAHGLVRSVPIAFGGRTFILRATATHALPAESAAGAWVAGIGGALLAIVLSGLLWILGARNVAVRDRDRLVERLEVLVRTDALTGAANRRALEERFLLEAARARRYDSPLAIAVLDIDAFKAFNDTHGHPAGDRLLRDAVAAWSAVLRDTDLLARVGGDEFAVLLPDCPAVELLAVSSRLQNATPHDQRCSVGVATSTGEEPLDAVLVRADASMYSSKASALT